MDGCATKQDFMALCLTLIPFLAFSIATCVVNFRSQADLAYKIDALIQGQGRNQRLSV
jgi:hypothetical protein